MTHRSLVCIAIIGILCFELVVVLADVATGIDNFPNGTKANTSIRRKNHHHLSHKMHHGHHSSSAEATRTHLRSISEVMLADDVLDESSPSSPSRNRPLSHNNKRNQYYNRRHQHELDVDTQDYRNYEQQYSWYRNGSFGQLSYTDDFGVPVYAVKRRHSKRHRNWHGHQRYHDNAANGAMSGPSVAELLSEDVNHQHPEEPDSTSPTASDKQLTWPSKKEAIMEGDLILGGLMMVHSRDDSQLCGPIMPQGGIQALEAMLYTLDRINSDRKLIPNVTIGAHILDDCDRDSYGLEMAVDFIKGK